MPIRATPSSSSSTSSSTSSSLFLYTTDEFVRRLKTRGYPVNIPLRDALQRVLLRGLAQDKTTAHTSDFWLHLDTQTERDLTQLTLTAACTGDSTLSLPMYCAILCPLHTYDLNYINLAVVLHGLQAQEVKNFYRHGYLEWMHAEKNTQTNDDTHTRQLWAHTPRTFSQLSIEELRVEWAALLRRCVCEYASCVFFVNRLYSYLTPCG